MKLTPLQKRAERKSRNQTMVDMNLVSLIDVFTILIFFLLSSASGVELLPSPKAVKLPSRLPTRARRKRSSSSSAKATSWSMAAVSRPSRKSWVHRDDLIAPLKAELDLLSNRQVVRAENQAQTKAVTIMGDKNIPYQLLRKVMYTSARANFTDVSFAVRRRDA